VIVYEKYSLAGVCEPAFNHGSHFALFGRAILQTAGLRESTGHYRAGFTAVEG
jgi:hypothetical protein